MIVKSAIAERIFVLEALIVAQSPKRKHNIVIVNFDNLIVRFPDVYYLQLLLNNARC
jgi:hypothetical protein